MPTIQTLFDQLHICIPLILSLLKISYFNVKLHLSPCSHMDPPYIITYQNGVDYVDSRQAALPDPQALIGTTHNSQVERHPEG